MIAFGSQRGYGRDLATHLMNTHDNQTLAFGGVRGAIADDLHGAFAEWEAQAHALTKCRNYLYSLSVNPDPAQGKLSRDQYLDYIARAEKRLGLEGQPRAIVFHEKYGREHCHVVWSRIDVREGKAIHVAFDRQSLMMVTKEFARDHGLKLPEGYEKKGISRQTSLYEKVQQDETGITQEDRIRDVTSAWQQSDTPQAFIRALEDKGYILATGKRPYVLIDIYGHMNALPKLIDDRSVRTKDIRKFLENEFPVESLPTVDEARRLAAQHLKARGDAQRSETAEGRRVSLANKQEKRRAYLEEKKEELEGRQGEEKRALLARQRFEALALTQHYREESARVRSVRDANRPSGLAAFLGRVTGVALVTKKIHEYRDRQRLHRYLAMRDELRRDHEHEQAMQEQRHKLQTLDFERHVKALQALDLREKKSLEVTLLRESRTKAREEEKSRGDEDGKAPVAEVSEAFGKAAGADSDSAKPDVAEAFKKAAEPRKRRRRKRKARGSSETDDQSQAPKRRRRRRDRDPGRGR